MIFIIGISFAFFLQFLLLVKQNKSNADKLLAVMMLTVGIHLLLFFIRFEEKYSFFPLLLGLDIPFPLLYGPILYLYSAALTNQLAKRSVINYLHFIPFLISLFSILPFLILPLEDKEYVFQHNGEGYEIYNMVNFAAILLSGIVYFSWVLVLLRKHRKKIGNYFSNTDKLNLNWLRYLTYGIVAIWLVVAFFDELFIFGSVVVYVLLLAFMGIKQTDIFSPARVNEQQNNRKEPSITDKPNEVTGKYDKSGVTNELSERIYNSLVQLINEKKVFTDSEISLNTLAKMLNTRPNYLSQTINEKTGNNFYTYINNLRIEEFKYLIALPEKKNQTIFSVASDCGFNSKSSFHKYFKQSTRQTPSEYLNKLESAE